MCHLSLSPPKLKLRSRQCLPLTSLFIHIPSKIIIATSARSYQRTMSSTKIKHVRVEEQMFCSMCLGKSYQQQSCSPCNKLSRAKETFVIFQIVGVWLGDSFASHSTHAFERLHPIQLADDAFATGNSVCMCQLF